MSIFVAARADATHQDASTRGLTTAACRQHPATTGRDRDGVAWAHPDPLYLAGWLARRNALLRTIAAATARRPRKTGRVGSEPNGP